MELTKEYFDKKFNSLEAKMVTKDNLVNFATKDDLVNFATKDNLVNFATKDDFVNFATKDDLKGFATKDDLDRFATKDDLDAQTLDLKAFTIEQTEELARIVNGGFEDVLERIDVRGRVGR